MKILFVRHGQSEDDLINAYGGWADFPLTDTGKKQIQSSAKLIKELKISFNKIISSSLLRALATSEIIAKELGLEIEVYEYLKERNSYGVLSGVNKDVALRKYPDQISNLENDLYVDGSERIEDLRIRINKALEYIKKQNTDLIIVTHGSFLKELFNFLGMKLVKKEDGGFALFEFNNGNWELIKSNGLEFGN